MTLKTGANTSLIALLLFSWTLTACVTVHVNFPEGAVREAASDYVDELYKAKQEEESKAEDNKTSSYRGPANFWVALLIPQAHAVDFHMDSAKVKSIQGKQKKRIADILKFKKMGAIGETDKGLLEVKDDSKVKGKVEKLKMKRLVSSENKDRDALYKEIIASNNLNSQMETRIRTIFFEKFKQADPAGSFFKAKGQWKSK